MLAADTHVVWPCKRRAHKLKPLPNPPEKPACPPCPSPTSIFRRTHEIDAKLHLYSYVDVAALSRPRLPDLLDTPDGRGVLHGEAREEKKKLGDRNLSTPDEKGGGLDACSGGKA